MDQLLLKIKAVLLVLPEGALGAGVRGAVINPGPLSLPGECDGGAWARAVGPVWDKEGQVKTFKGSGKETQLASSLFPGPSLHETHTVSLVKFI